jgi:hypothetical protein
MKTQTNTLSSEQVLRDLVLIIKENMKEAKSEPKDDYNKGVVFAYYDVLSVIQMQAKNLGFNLNELNLESELIGELVY